MLAFVALVGVILSLAPHQIRLFPVSAQTATIIVDRWGCMLSAPNRQNMSRIAAYVAGDCYAITEFHRKHADLYLCGYYVSPLDATLGVGRHVLNTVLQDGDILVDYAHLRQTNQKAYFQLLTYL